MQARSRSRKRTFTEQARRAQIVRAAIETIAELGYSRASFSRIARRAGLSSTGLISYHFTGKDELMSAVVHDVIGRFTEFVVPRMDAQRSASAELRAFVQANLDFMAAHRADLVALLAIRANLRGEDLAGQEGARDDVAKLTDFLRAGQRAGEFRRFDPRVMAVAILSLRDGVLQELAANPDLDLAAYRRELVHLVELATRADVGAAGGAGGKE